MARTEEAEKGLDDEEGVFAALDERPRAVEEPCTKGSVCCEGAECLTHHARDA